jgi:hypothetical protein
MWSATRIALLSLFLCLPAQAQEIQVGSTLACDTQQQVQRFVRLYHGDAADAAKTVNAEVKDPSACDMVAVAYVSGPEIATVRTQSRTYRIVRILVVGIVTAAGIAPAEPSMFYSIVPVDERGA